MVFDGSGAAIPPVAVDARVLVRARRDVGLRTRTASSSPTSSLTMDERVAEQARELTDVPVLPFDLRLRPVAPLEGRRTAVFTTGPAPVDHLDAEVVHVSRNLASRDALAAELADLDADVFLVEIKAAAIDVVAEAALERGAEVVFADNEVVARRARRGAPRARPRAGGRLMAERRLTPAPLGQQDGLPYSKGVMARALMATGIPADARLRARRAASSATCARAARRPSTSTGSRRSPRISSARTRVSAAARRLRRSSASARSTYRSSSSSAAPPARASPPSRPRSPTGSGSPA